MATEDHHQPIDVKSHPETTMDRIMTTHAQREIFLIEKMRPDNKTSIWFYQLIQGPLNLDILSKAIEQLVLEIPLLQTQFNYADGELWQYRDRNIKQKIKTIDISDHSEPLKEVFKRMNEAANQPMVITDKKLYDFSIYIIDEKVYAFYAKFHHAIIDVRSWAKLESMIAEVYNSLIAAGRELHIDALAQAEQTYIASKEYKDDETFWINYVQQLTCNAFTHRSNDSVVNKEITRCIHTISGSRRKNIQQAAAALNISESMLYIGISAVLIRSLIGSDNVSLSLPVRATDPTRELGMTSNVVPLLVHVCQYDNLNKVLSEIAQETKSVLKHQRYPIADILKHAKYDSNNTFGPFINIMRYDHGVKFEDCTRSSYFGENIDKNDLQITFWADGPDGRLDIMFDDSQTFHTTEQLIALKKRLLFIIDIVVNAPDSTVNIIDDFDDRCRCVKTIQHCSNFYQHRRTPVAAGFLMWNSSVDYLLCFVNSVKWTGSGPSGFVMPKVLLFGRVVGIGKLERVVDIESTEAPGTLLKINKNSWYVSVADGVVEISNFVSERGQPISAMELAKQCNLHNFLQLPAITSKQVDWLQSTYRQCFSNESHWSERFSKFEPSKLSIPLRDQMDLPPLWTATEYQSFQIPSLKINHAEFLAAWFIYIARNSQASELQIGWDATESISRRKSENGIDEYSFEKTVPYWLSINMNDTFSVLMKSVHEENYQVSDNSPCLTEIRAKHSSGLAHDMPTDKPWPLAFSFIYSKSVLSSDDSDSDPISLSAHGSLLTLQINPTIRKFRWIYDKNKIEEEEVNNISKRLLSLLASAKDLKQDVKPICKLPILSNDERRVLFTIWNQTDETFPITNCLHELFETQVLRNGQAIAVECEGKTLTYAELNMQANKLAHHLIERGIKPDDRIAICVNRSVKMLVAILGVLKSGGAYVPLDPIYSSQRLTNILEDADPSILLADMVGQKALGNHQVPVLNLDEELPDHLPVENPNATKLGLTAANLAYIMYTSGSTGTPKGVMIEHRSVLNLVHAMTPLLGMTPKSHVMLFASYSSKASASEIFVALSSGARLCVPSDEVCQSDDALFNYMRVEKITHTTITPSRFQNTQNLDNLKEIQSLNFSGEMLPIFLLRAAAQHTKVFNIYGPNETTATVTTWSCPEDYSGDSVPIGRPISNTKIYLLDENQELVPLGAEGEIYISGAGLARGYFKQPKLTAERFLPNPFSKRPADRIYRTGDRARYLPDGNLVFLGRIDQQVKIQV